MINFHIDHRLFQSELLYFDVPVADARAQVIKIDHRLQYGTGEYFITVKEPEITDEGVEIVHFEAEAGWMRLADRKKVGDFELAHTPADGLAAILDGTGWTVGFVTSDATEYGALDTDKSVLEWIWTWARVTGNEVWFNSLDHSIDFIPEVGLDLGLSFRYSKNIQSITRTETPPTCTRLYAFGKEKLDITSLTSGGAPYIEDYSWYMTSEGLTLLEAQAAYQKDQTLQDESFVDAASLYAWAQTQLAAMSQPSVVYAAKVVDLSTLVGYDEGGFSPGDTVWVEAEPIAVSERARVSRRDWYPYEPERDVVELSFNPIVIPNTSTTTSRSSQREWELFQSRNENTIRKVRIGSTILHRLALRTIEGAEWALHYNVEGVGVGSGTVTIEAFDAETLETLWPTQTFTISNGVRFNWQFSYGDQDISSGDHALTIRAYSSSSSVGIDIAAGQTAFWVLARGTVRQNFTLPNSIRYDFTGLKQYFTAPDDVYEVLAEFHGSGVGAGGTVGGGMVKCKVPVIPGQVYEIQIAGGSFGYPNGGQYGNAGPFGASWGCGSSHMVRDGLPFTSALVVAAGAGGSGEGSASNPSPFGGIGGFYNGGDGAGTGGKGATQFAGGDGNTGGSAGTQGQGGNASGSGNAFDFAGGGGGGGWYGGEGGQAASPPSQRGGGGGSGWIDPSCYDLEILDGENTGNGYAILSWEDPLV